MTPHYFLNPYFLNRGCANLFRRAFIGFSFIGHPTDFHWSRYFEGDSKILTFQDAPRFPKLIFPTLSRFHHPPSTIQKVSRSFQICFRCSGIYLCSKIIHNYSRFTESPPSCFPFLFKNDRDWRLFWTLQIIILSCCCPPGFPTFSLFGFSKCWDT